MSSPRFITVDKSDPNFFNYLWGSTSERIKYIPVQSLNVGSNNESITFEVKPDAEIQKPNFFLKLNSVVKFKSYLFILFPLFFVIAKNNIASHSSDPFSLSFAVLALLFVYGGLNIRNDISDHISGFDRVNIPFSKKPILSGWVTAKCLSVWSWALIAIGLVLSMPVLILYRQEIKVVAIVAGLILAGQFLQKNSYKEKQWGELILFLIIGAGVSIGLQVAAGAAIDTEIIVFGIFWGAAILFLVHINSFSHLLTSTQAGIKNSITNLGFDKAKLFLMIWWSLCLVLWFLFHLYFSSPQWTWVQSGLLLVASLPFFERLRKTRSPLSSDLIKIRKSAHITFLAMVFLFFVECVSKIGNSF